MSIHGEVYLLRATRHCRTDERASSRQHAGVTLIELLVVMAILAVLVGLALPRLDTAGFRADANVRLVRTTLQRAQRLSLQQQHDVIVSFDIAGGRIRVAEDVDNNRAVGAGDPVVWRGLTDAAAFIVPATGIYGTVTKAVSGSSLATLDAMPTLTFRRNGSASSSAEIYLRVNGRKTDAVRGVTLVQSTARTDWFKRVGSTWKAGGL